MKLSIDIETYSEAELKTVGVYKYAEHPSTRVLCICYRFNDEEVQTYVPDRDGAIPYRLRRHIENGGEIHAYNAEFERTVLNGVAGDAIKFPKISIEQSFCTMAKARASGIAGGLGDVAEHLGTHPKDEGGKNVMLQLSKPRRKAA